VSKVTLAVVVLACLTVTACGGSNDTDASGEDTDASDEGGSGDEDKTFEGDGYSFTYPADWSEKTGEIEARAQAGSEQATSEVAVAPGEGQDLVLVEVGPTSPSITEDNIDHLEEEIARLVESLFQQGAGQVTAGPNRVTVAGLPALRFEGTGVTSDDVSVRSRLTLIYDGRNQFAVNCQFTPEGAEEIERGCDQILGSFQVEGGQQEGRDKTFEGDGYSFTYPGGWSQSGPAPLQGTDVPVLLFGPREGADRLLVNVTRAGLSITERNIDEVSAQFAGEVDQLFRRAEGRLTKGPTRLTVGGLPALRFEGSGVTPEGDRIRSQVTVVFGGRTQYFLSCEFTPEGAEEMKRGCDQVVESFQVE
jgi:PsbP-like protein